MRFIIIICGLVFLFQNNLSLAQERDLKKLSHHQRHKVAHSLIKRGSYYNAIDQLNELVTQYPEEKEFTFRLAEAYFHSRDYKNAEAWYKKTMELDGKNTSLASFKYAESLKYNGKYKEAKENFATFSTSNYREQRKERYKAIAKHEVESCEFALKEINSSVFADIDHLGNNINSAYSEFSPVQPDANTLIFASLQADSVLSAKHDEVHSYHTKIYSSKSSGGEWTEPSEIKVLNSLYENSANGSFSSDKSKFYFTKCRENRNHQMICQIYVSEVVNGEFKDPKKLDGLVNLEGYSYTQPYSVTTGTGRSKAEVLYFVSNMPGGKGGLDIWYTTFNKDGNCKKPVNLGFKINTIRDEISPYIDADSSVMYFSSNYHNGFGGYDIFRASGKQTKWESPANLGVPINSSVDDVYFTLKPNKKEAFIVSNRVGGINLKSPTCCDDIYSISYKPATLIALKVFDRTNKNTKLQHAKVYLLSPKDSLEAIDPADSTRKIMIAQFDTIPVYYNKNPLSINSEDVNYFFRPENNKNYTLKIEIPGGEVSEMNISTDADLQYTHSVSSDSLFKVKNIKDEKSNILVVDAFVNPGGMESTTASLAGIDGKSSGKSSSKEGSEMRSKIQRERDYTTISSIMKNKKLDKKSPTDLEFTVMLNYEVNELDFIEVIEGSLDSLVELMQNYEDLKIEISAHTDSSGTAAYNHHLSKKRANVISHYLHSKGVSKKRMNAIGYGFSKPIAPNFNADGTENEEGRALNRRAEIKITKAGRSTKEKTKK